MKTRLIVMMAAVLALVLMGPMLDAQTNVRPWSAVGSTCAPDDDTPYFNYEVMVSSGYIEHRTSKMGDLYFTCNVTTPVDSWPGEPDWNRLYLTFKDTDRYGNVQAMLYRKNLLTGVVAAIVAVTSTDGAGVRSTYSLVPTFNFDTYAYFVQIRITRVNTVSDQEFHIVRLQHVE